METWKINALVKSLPFALSAFSMLFTIGTEATLILDYLIFKTEISHTSYPIYLAMFLEIFIQSCFYLSSEFKRKKLHIVLIISLIYLMLLIAGAFNNTMLWEQNMLKLINRTICMFVAIAVALSDICIITEVFMKNKPKEVKEINSYSSDEFN